MNLAYLPIQPLGCVFSNRFTIATTEFYYLPYFSLRFGYGGYVFSHMGPTTFEWALVILFLGIGDPIPWVWLVLLVRH